MTYLALAALFVVPVAALAVVVARARGLGRRWWTTTALTLVILLVLTVVFDSLMIHLDLFRYDEEQLTGVRLLLAPVEDLAWPLVAALLLPALWELLRRRPDAAGAGRVPDADSTCRPDPRDARRGPDPREAGS